jgi:hypothetical protein
LLVNKTAEQVVYLDVEVDKTVIEGLPVVRTLSDGDEFSPIILLELW